MRVPDGRTFRPKTQADVNRDGRKADDILARRISRQPKIPEAGAASVIGNAEAFSDTYTQDDYGLIFTSFSFTSHDYWPGDGAPSLVASGTDEFDPTVAGWYQAHAHVTLSISGSGGVPPFVRLEVNPDATANVDSVATDERAMLTDGSSRFVHTVVSTGHFYHPGAGEGNHYLGFRISYPNTPGVVVQAANVSYMLDRVR